MSGSQPRFGCAQSAGARAVICLGFVGLAAVGGARASAPRPGAPPPSEEQQAAAAIGRALEAHGPDVHRCFERALADRLDVAGKVEVELAIKDGGRVGAAKVLTQGAEVPPVLARCVVEAANGWTLAGLEPGAAVVLPFIFAGQNDQFVVKAADVPERGPAAGKPRGGAKSGGPFSVKVLVDPENVRGPNASLTLLTVGPASRVAMHRHPRSAKIIYLLAGRARLLGPPGAEAIELDPGTAVYLPVGYPHVIENRGRSAGATLLQAFSPPGPERVYRDPKDRRGREDFEVIRNPAQAKPASAARPAVVKTGEAEALPLLGGGKGSVKILFDEKVTGDKAMALDLIEFPSGAEVARHDHGPSTELLYVVSGPGGTLTVGREAAPFAAQDALHVPAGQPHAAKLAVGAPTVALQIYAPAGPEQRFRVVGEAMPGAPGKTAPGAPASNK